MPTAEPPGTLPTIEERIDADYLAATLDTATRARLSSLVQPAPGHEQHLRLLPSQQLRRVVRQAVAVLQDAGLADTPLEQLDQRQLERLAAGDLALAELATRQAAALDRLQANPPPCLVTVLGRPTLKLSKPWRELAGRIQSYRLQYAITDPTRTLGPRPTGLTQRADRSRIATDLAWSPFGPMPAVHDPTWLNVIDQPDRDPTDALTTLRDPTWDATALPHGITSQLLNSPSAMLRHQLARALGLLRRRPADLTEQPPACAPSKSTSPASPTSHPSSPPPSPARPTSASVRSTPSCNNSTSSSTHESTGTPPTRPSPKPASPPRNYAAASCTPCSSSPSSHPPGWSANSAHPPPANQPAPHGSAVPAPSSPTAPPTASKAPNPSTPQPTPWPGSTTASPPASSTWPSSNSSGPPSRTHSTRRRSGPRSTSPTRSTRQADQANGCKDSGKLADRQPGVSCALPGSLR
ncbi:MAG TPA: hypothetical protein VFA46_04885 [Actinomycetes bacterium]|nr:hypothetical protein [Actinomycetes bacterium]